MHRRNARLVAVGLKGFRAQIVSIAWGAIALWIASWLGLTRRESVLFGAVVYLGTLLIGALIVGRTAESDALAAREFKPSPAERIWIDHVTISAICETARPVRGELSHQLDQRRKRYEGNWRHLDVTVADVQIWDDGNGVVAATLNQESRFPSFSLYFGPEHRQRLLILNRGDQIKVAGHLEAVSEHNLYFDVCYFVDGSDPNVASAPDSFIS